MDEEKREIGSINEYIGINTNNVAEYNSLLIGLEMCKEKGVKDIDIKMDSMLVVNQITGKWRVKNVEMRKYNLKCNHLLSSFDNWSINHVYRKNNKRADELVNEVLDNIKEVE